jgi:hypothetical protein
MNLITDTNIWYQIASGGLIPAEIKCGGTNSLYATPINILEIISNVSDFQFERRRNVIRAIIEHADLILEDTETYLTHLWGFNYTRSNIQWNDILLAVDEANNLDNLRTGVLDFVRRVTRTVNVDFAHFWRTDQWNDFRLSIEEVIDQHLPGYFENRRNGRAIYMNQINGDNFRNLLFSDITQDEILRATYDRNILVINDLNVLLTTGQRTYPISAEIRENAYNSLRPYIFAYAQYLYRCATTYTPQDNDWGDLEPFIYLQGDNRLFTLEGRWIDICDDSGNENLLFRI